MHQTGWMNLGIRAMLGGSPWSIWQLELGVDCEMEWRHGSNLSVLSFGNAASVVAIVEAVVPLRLWTIIPGPADAMSDVLESHAAWKAQVLWSTVGMPSLVDTC